MSDQFRLDKTEYRLKDGVPYKVMVSELWTKRELSAIVEEINSTSVSSQKRLDDLSDEYDTIEALLNE